ncbi:serine/threonine protein kinase [Streptomycetaceae bacterium NBC_01309]
MSVRDGYGDDPESVGPYRIVGRLGAGGMGVVLLGEDADGRRAAVKVVREQYAADPHFRSRFRREIASMRRVHGRGVAEVLGWDTEGPRPWFAAEYIEGPTLAEYVAGQGPLPLGPLTALAAGVAEAVAAVHAAGVVHRDLKPSNVMLAQDGPKVLDFGIAKTADANTVTQTGLVMGSPGWLSPEQLRGDPTGPPSDVFTLGLLIGYASSGTSPFGTGSAEALAYRILAEPPRLEGVPAELRGLVAAALAKRAADRPSATDVLEYLRSVGLEGTDATGENDVELVTGLLRRQWSPELARTDGLKPPPWPPRSTDPGADARQPGSRRGWPRWTAAVAAAAMLAAVGYGASRLTDDSSDNPSGPVDAANVSGGNRSSTGSGNSPSGSGTSGSTTSGGGTSSSGTPTTTTPPSTAPPSSPAPPAAVDLTGVDWRNRGYPDVCATDGDTSRSIQVRAGTAPPSDGTGADTELQDPVYGRLDGRSVAVLPILCTGLNHTPEYLIAYVADKEAAQLLDFELMTGGQRYIQSVQISGEALVVTYVGHQPSAPLSSPNKTVRSTYRLQGERLVPEESTVVQGTPTPP